MFFGRKQLDDESKSYFLAPLCKDIETHCQKGMYRTDFSMYNSKTGRPQEFALSVTKEGNDIYRFSGVLVEVYKMRNVFPSDYETWFSDLETINPNFKDTDAAYPLKRFKRKLKPVSKVFEVLYVDGHLTTVFFNSDTRISDKLYTLFISYVVEDISFPEYLKLQQFLLSKTQFVVGSPNPSFKQLLISRDDTKDLEEAQSFYSIRQNGLLFEVVELNPTYLYFGYYDLDYGGKRGSQYLVYAYIDEEQAIYELNQRVLREYIRPDQRI